MQCADGSVSKLRHAPSTSARLLRSQARRHRVAGQQTAVGLAVRRLFCGHADCAKKAFAEQVEYLTFRYGRRTVTVQCLPHQVALALDGQSGGRFAAVDRPVSGPTPLRPIRSMVETTWSLLHRVAATYGLRIRQPLIRTHAGACQAAFEKQDRLLSWLEPHAM